MENTRIMFLRNESYRPVGCIAITVNRHSKTASYQFSVLNPADNFDRKIARQLAIGRLVEQPIDVYISNNASMHDISESVMVDLAFSERAPTRAIKAAKLWLQYNLRTC
jgi:hypothetical protein